jgi:hypothetical protein
MNGMQSGMIRFPACFGENPGRRPDPLVVNYGILVYRALFVKLGAVCSMNVNNLSITNPLPL